MSDQEAREYKPTVVHVDRRNRIVSKTHEQLAGQKYVSV
jgi:aspartate 1-decarboxylase